MSEKYGKWSFSLEPLESEKGCFPIFREDGSAFIVSCEADEVPLLANSPDLLSELESLVNKAKEAGIDVTTAEDVISRTKSG